MDFLFSSVQLHYAINRNVFFIPCDDIDNPELVCENISDFLNNLKKAES